MNTATAPLPDTHKVTSTLYADGGYVSGFKSSTEAHNFAQAVSETPEHLNQAVKVWHLERVICTYRNGRRYNGM